MNDGPKSRSDTSSDEMVPSYVDLKIETLLEFGVFWRRRYMFFVYTVGNSDSIVIYDGVFVVLYWCVCLIEALLTLYFLFFWTFYVLTLGMSRRHKDFFTLKITVTLSSIYSKWKKLRIFIYRLSYMINHKIYNFFENTIFSTYDRPRFRSHIKSPKLVINRISSCLNKRILLLF